MTRAVALAALLAAACSSEGELTEIIVVVDTDLAVPAELDQVRITVDGLGDSRQVATASLASASALPITSGLVHRGGPLGPISVTATGLSASATRVERMASVSFQQGRTVVLRMDLVSACIGVPCGEDETCEAGACRPIAVLPSELIEWTGAPDRLDGSTPPPDAGAMDAGVDVDAGDAPDAGDIDAGEMDAGGPDAGPVRVTNDLVVLYTFDEGSGNIVNDTSGVGVPMSLSVAVPAAVTWGPGSITLNAATIIETAGPATKVIDACMASNEITVEAWLEAANTTQGGPARIVTCSANTGIRNFTLGQSGDRMSTRLATTTQTSPNGYPEIFTPAASFTTALTHVVYTRDTAFHTRIFLDGVEAATLVRDGDFSNWDTTHPFGLGNEITQDRTWLGTLHLVAVYSRALTPAEITTNFTLGPNGDGS